MRIHKLLPFLPPLQTVLRNKSLSAKLLFPALLSIELTNYCNASCIMCPRKEMTRRMQHLEFHLFKKIIDDCRNRPLKKINLFWFGESLIYPGFLEALEYIKENLPSVKVIVSTNAGLLTQEISRRIVSKNLVTTLNIDLDGITSQTAEKIRPGTDFKKVMENTGQLLEIKKKLRKKSPEIRMTIIEMEDNRKEIADFCKYWHGKVDRVDVNCYNTWMGTMPDRGLEKGSGQLKKFDFPCEHPWNELVIASDGRASLCCLDFDCQAVVGDVSKESVAEIWSGKRLNRYREKLLNNDYRGIICQNCNACIFQEDSIWRSLFIKYCATINARLPINSRKSNR